MQVTAEFLLFEDVTEQSFDKVDSRQFQGDLLHDSKSLAAYSGKGSSVIINASVGARKGWPTTSTVSTCKAAVVHLARILSAGTHGPRDSREFPKPRPDGHGDVRSFPGEEQGEAVKDVLRTNNPSKRMADPLEIREAGSLPRVRTILRTSSGQTS